MTATRAARASGRLAALEIRPDPAVFLPPSPERLSDAAEAVALLDAERRIIDVSRGFTELFGYGADDARGVAIDALIVPEDLRPGSESLSQRASAGRVCADVVRRRRDGRLLELSVYGAPTVVEGRHALWCVYRPGSQRRAAARDLGQCRHCFRMLLDHAHDVVALLTPRGEVEYVSPSLGTVLGLIGEAVSGEVLLERVEEGDRKPLLEALRGSGTAQLDLRVRHTDGSQRVLETTVRNLVHDPAVQGITLYARDVTQRRGAEDALRAMALHDPLTGLPNRIYFNERVVDAGRRARQRGGRGFAVFFLDLDRFKLVNDSFGHPVGDRFLQTAAARLATCIRPADTVARIGGDEFAVLLEEVRGPEDALAVAARITQVMSEPVSLDGNEAFISASIGIVFSSAEAPEHPEHLLRDADVAMYRAKQAGGACAEVFDHTMRRESRARLRLESDLRHGLERGEFCLHYQPVVCLSTGRIAGFEALIRWRHPRRGLVSPDDFIPAAEESGFIVPLGEWVLRTAAAQLHEWQHRFPSDPPLSLSVNLSVRQLGRNALDGVLAEVLQACRVAPGTLKLEITESLLMEGTGGAADILQRFRGMGALISLDDFGTGYSSLRYLHHLPFDELKVDRSFVSRMETDPNAAQLVRTILLLAEGVGVSTVAEGVSTHAQLKALRALGCGYAQGFLFSPAVEAGTAEMLLGRPAGSVTRCACCDRQAW